MRLAPKGYIEKHHIIPKCMGGGEGNNIVALAAKRNLIPDH